MSDFTDEHSGIGDYHFSLGSTPDGQDILPRKSFGLDANFTSVAITIGELSLQEDNTYYGTIYAIDRVGNESFQYYNLYDMICNLVYHAIIIIT